MVTFSFNLMAIVCVIHVANLFLLTKNDIKFMHYNKFPNLGVYRATFPNLKGHRGPSEIATKSLEPSLSFLIMTFKANLVSKMILSLVPGATHCSLLLQLLPGLMFGPGLLKKTLCVSSLPVISLRNICKYFKLGGFSETKSLLLYF